LKGVAHEANGRGLKFALNSHVDAQAYGKHGDILDWSVEKSANKTE
jgi:hypothetical protein